MVAPAAGGSLRDVLPDCLGHVRALAWKDAETIRFTADEGTETVFAEVKRDGSARKTIVPKGGVLLSAFDQGGARSLAFLAQTPRHPPELYVMCGGETTRINNTLREALRLLGGSGKRPDPGRVKVIMILSDFQFCAKDLRVSGLDEGTHVIAVGFGVRNYDRRKLNDLRFDERMKKLASHIEQASKDVSEVRISSDKISRRFQQIERVELEHPDTATARLLDADE